SGKAALLLALPPGYASAIFPPAGIAVGATLILGSRAVPCVFLSALLLNAWTGFSASQGLNATGLTAALVIAVASALQAWMGGWMLRRAIGYPSAFDKGTEIFRFMLLAPVICVVSPALSVSGLALLGIVDPASFAANWLSWWAGDLLGVLMMVPVVLALAGEPRKLWRSRIRTVAIPMVLGLALFVAMYLKVNQWEQDVMLTEYRQVSQQSLDQIRLGLLQESAMLTQMQGLFVRDPKGHVTREEFHRYCQHMLKDFPMIQVLEWVARVPDPDRQRFEAAQDKEMPGFHITERSERGTTRPAERREMYYPATYIEPLQGNEAALGFDVGSGHRRSEALNRANASEQTVTTAPITLVQGGAGMLILKAVRIDGRPAGLVMAVLKLREFISHAVPAANNGNLYIRLLDVDAGLPLFDSFPDKPVTALTERFFDFGERHYLLLTSPTPAYYHQHRSWQSWGVLALGTFGTTLLGALLLLGSGYTARVESQVAERTEALRESEERFRTTMEYSPIGIVIAGLQGEFLQTNQAFCDIVGYRKEELSHLTAIDLTYLEDRPANTEYRRQLLLGEIKTFHMEKRYMHKGGHLVWVQLAASLVRSADGTPKHFIAQVEDITERKNLELQLVQEARTDALTGLYNRRYFYELAAREMALSKRLSGPLALLQLDIDHFKDVNDSHGHDVGDAVLRALANTCRQTLREIDVVARFGGEEFTVLLPSADKEHALEAAERLRTMLSKTTVPAGASGNISFTVSIGVTNCLQASDSLDHMLKRADNALY
ncbi:MAG: diguanylate cyclase, partial [Betaproteobacteria bacterium]|nr:diguanylate cyclase [Betaproteobacteria bacterium]